MSVINVQHGIVSQSNAVKLRQRRQGAAHAVNAVDCHDGAAIRARFAKSATQVHGIAMREEDDADAVGLGDLRPFLDRIVGLLVDHQKILPAHQARNRAHVGQRDGRVNQDRLDAEPFRQLFLGLFIGADARKSARSAIVGAPAVDAAAYGILHARILIQAQKTIRPKIDYPMAFQQDLPVRANLLHDQILQMGRGEKRLKVLDEADQSVLPQNLRQQLHRRF